MAFDVRRGRWSTAPGPRPRAYLGVSAVQGRIVAAGGRTGGLGTQTSHAEIYASGVRRWRALPAMPKAMSEAAAAWPPEPRSAAAFVRGRLYALGGSDYRGRFPASPYSQFGRSGISAGPRDLRRGRSGCSDGAPRSGRKRERPVRAVEPACELGSQRGLALRLERRRV